MAPGLPQFIGDSLGALYGHLHDEQAKPGVSYVIYHGEVNLDAAGPVEVCVPYDGQVEPAGEIRLRVEAAHDVAYTRISKRQVEFPGILEAYDAVGCWAAESERGIAGPPREIYIVDWDRAELDDLACDVAFPLG